MARYVVQFWENGKLKAVEDANGNILEDDDLQEAISMAREVEMMSRSGSLRDGITTLRVFDRKEKRVARAVKLKGAR